MRTKKTGVLIGGSGLIGGTLLHHFKQSDRHGVAVLAPNSKELSLRVPEDIRAYFERVEADFIINCAIASIDSDPQLAMEVNTLGPVYLARTALELGIPYVHFSSAALMPSGRGLREGDRLPLGAGLPNYAKGKLIAELALEHLHRTQGLDYTCIRLAIVYGTHDHKIQGFQHLLYSLANRSMPFLFTTPQSAHSYTNATKLPGFVAHVLEHREEFFGQTFNFVDREPVPLSQLILTMKAQLGASTPREIYVPLSLAKLLTGVFSRVLRLAARVGVEARIPAELVFLDDFYRSQVLSREKLAASSWVDEEPDATALSELPELIRYYVDRWERFNLIAPRDRPPVEGAQEARLFHERPERLLESLSATSEQPFLRPGRSSPGGRP